MNSRTIKLSTGRDVTIHSPKAGGVMRFLTALKKANVDPSGFSAPRIIDALTADQRKEVESIGDAAKRAERLTEILANATDEQRRTIEATKAAIVASVVSLLQESEFLLTAAILAFTDLNAEDVGELELIDAVSIVATSVEVIDFGSILAAVGRLTAAVGNIYK